MRMIRFLAACLVAVLLAAGAHAGSLQPRANGGCTLSNPLPGDVNVGVAPTRLFSTCGVRENWCNRHFADVVANNVTYTINFVNCIPDTRRLAQLMGNINPNFGIGGLPMARWYDQMGSGDDCVQNTAANRLSVWLINGKVEIAGDGWFYKYISGSVIDRFCRVAGVSTNAQASTWYFAGTPFQYGAPAQTSGSAGTLFQPGAGCCSGGNGAGFQFAGYAGTGTAVEFGMEDWDTFTQLASPILWPENQPSVIGLVLSAASTTVTQNEETPVNFGSVLSAQTMTGVTVGVDQSSVSTGSGFYGAFQALMVYGSTTLSTGNQQSVRNSLYAMFSIGKNPAYSVIGDGASYDNSTGGLVGGVQGDGWVTQMFAQVPYPVRFVNTAVYGATVANLITAWNALPTFPCTGSFSKVVYIGPGVAAGNSINDGETGAQAFTDTTNLLSLVKSKCPSITNVIVTTLSGGGELANYSALVRSNAASMGYTVSDWANNIVMGPASNTNPALFNQVSPYIDHPNVAGYSWLASTTLGPLRAATGQ